MASIAGQTLAWHGNGGVQNTALGPSLRCAAAHAATHIGANEMFHLMIVIAFTVWCFIPGSSLAQLLGIRQQPSPPPPPAAPKPKPKGPSFYRKQTQPLWWP
jgi:hypothetical protein